MSIAAKQRVPEYAIYIIIWLMIFIVPMLVTTSNNGTFDKQVFVSWARLMPFLIIFIINAVWLLPELLLKGKTGIYLLSVVILSLLLVYVWDLIFPVLKDLIEGGVRVEPQSLRSLHPEQRPLRPEMRTPGLRPQLPMPDQQNPRIVNRLLAMLNQMVIAWLVVGLNAAIKVTNKWFKDEQIKRELEKEHLKSELAFLQNQISPHFFMNTLNNIHALIDIDTKEAQSSILTLSKMMRYLLYESDRGDTTLKRELEFLRSYVNLMQLRVDDSVEINLEVKVQNEDAQIHPLLFISFVENAFKHGISYKDKSFIQIEILQKNKYIEFRCNNSLSVKNDFINPYSGVGLENIKKRLNLLYHDNYQLDIVDLDAEFRVYLKIPVNEN